MDKVYLAITKTSLVGGVNHQGAGLPPKEEAPLNGTGAQEDVVEAPQGVVEAHRTTWTNPTTSRPRPSGS